MTDSYAAMKAILNPDPSPQMQALFAPRNGITFKERMFPFVLGSRDLYPEVFDESVLWLDSQYSVAGETTVVNQGTGGSALDATYGSTSGSDTNDPLLLTHTGENYVYLPGLTSNYLSVPNEAAFGISGDLEIQFSGAMDWNLSSERVLVSHWFSANIHFRLYTSTTDLRFAWTTTGGTETTADFPLATVGLVDGVRADIKLTHDVDNGSGQNVVTVYTSPDLGETWVQKGQVTNAGTVSRFVTSYPIEIGARSGGSVPLGSVYRTVIKDGIDGTTVFDFNAATDITDAGATSFTATSGQTVTVNRATSGRKTALVTRPVWLFGTDDFLEVADNPILNFGASDDFTVMLMARMWATSNAFSALLAKKVNATSTNAGYAIRFDSSGVVEAMISDGTTQVLRGSGTITAGELRPMMLVRSGTDNTLQMLPLASTTSDTTANSLANAETLKIGCYSNGGQFVNYEVTAVAVWRRVLTTDEIAAINAFYGTGA